MLVFHGPQRIEGKRSTVKERKRKKMEREREVCLWLVTRSREEIPLRTHTHTQVQKHREQRHVQEKKDLLCMSYWFGVYICALVSVYVCVCARLKVAEEAG